MASPSQPSVPTVDPALLGSALFLFREYLEQEAADNPQSDDDADSGEPAFDVDTRAVLDLFADELGTNVQTTLALYLRATALYRLLTRSPSLGTLALDEEEAAGTFTETALIAAARLDVKVTLTADDRTADFDPRQFREAIEG